MEVHKHPNHVTHKKKWGEYLLEFFMLFFAVFLGFVAENLREASVEHEREKQYAQQLYTEFYADSMAFAKKVNARLDKELDCDYIYSFIKDSSLTDLQWVDNVRKMNPNAAFLDLLNLYQSSSKLIEANILNLSTFNRDEAANMVMFYKTMMVSSRTLQMNDYALINHKILEELRKTYKLE